MGDEEKTEDLKKSPMDGILSAVKLEWIRPLFYNLGGRKLVLGGGGLAIIKLVVDSGADITWPKAVVCLAVAVLAVGTGWTIAKEDSGR